MSIFIKEEHLLADVSAMMSSELLRYRNNFFIFKTFYATFYHSYQYSLVLNLRALTP